MKQGKGEIQDRPTFLMRNMIVRQELQAVPNARCGSSTMHQTVALPGVATLLSKQGAATKKPTKINQPL